MRLDARHILILCRIVLAVLAIALIFIGVIAMIAPTPFGFVLVFLGLMILTFAAPGFIRFLRRRWRWIDVLLARIARRAPRWLMRALKQTDPGRDRPYGRKRGN